jgi:hypothetical protein
MPILVCALALANVAKPTRSAPPPIERRQANASNSAGLVLSAGKP